VIIIFKAFFSVEDEEDKETDALVFPLLDI